MTNTPTFTLRRLEMAMPLLSDAQKNDPKALVSLAAISMADESTLKLVSAGNTESLNVYVEKAYDMPSDEVAEVLHFFMQASQRFTLVLQGLTPNEINRLVATQAEALRTDLGLLGESATLPEDTN